MALTKDTPIKQSLGDRANLPLAAVNVYQGALVGMNSSGYARGLTLAAAGPDRFRGHAIKGMDNSGGSNGDKHVEVLRGRYWLQVALTGVAITDAIFSKPVFATDDGTLSLREGLMVGRVVRYVSSGVAIVEFDTELPVHILAETFVFGDFTDGGGATGHVDFAVKLPKGALVIGILYDVKTGFTGDSSAVVQTGVAGNVDRFSQDTTPSVFAAGVVGSGPAQVEANPSYVAAAVAARITVTSGTDFGSISAGEMDVRIAYLPTLLN